MWEDFYDDIKGKEFNSYEEYNIWVQNWVDKTKKDKILFINTELERIKEWSKTIKEVKDELDISIKEKL